MEDRDPFFLVRRNGEIYGYRNFCPHYGAPLDQTGCFSSAKDQILCSMHGALFNIDDGKCTDGPCPGQRLEAVKTEISDGEIYLIA